MSKVKSLILNNYGKESIDSELEIGGQDGRGIKDCCQDG